MAVYINHLSLIDIHGHHAHVTNYMHTGLPRQSRCIVESTSHLMQYLISFLLLAPLFAAEHLLRLLIPSS
jgi:hypothetical protein